MFLKASLENESTMDTMSVPFEGEKVRDNATESQLLLDSKAVFSKQSGRNTSQGLDSLGMNNYISKLGTLEEPSHTYSERFP